MGCLAVTGITGHSGGFLLERLVAERYPGTIRCLVRAKSDTSAIDRSGLDIEKVVGNLNREDSLRALMRGAHTVLHLYNIRASLAVAKAAAEEGAQRLVLVHTTGIFSENRSASQEYLAIEQKLDAFLADKDIDVTILRPTMIFGDLRDRSVHKFIRMVDRLPLMPEIDRGKGLLQPVNARDLGEMYYRMIGTSRLPEREYILSGDRPVTMHEMFAMIGEDLGKRVRFVNCPMALGEFFAKALRFCTRGRKDLLEKVQRMGEDRSFSHDAAARDLGFAPEPFEIGLKREVDQYLAQKNARR